MSKKTSSPTGTDSSFNMSTDIIKPCQPLIGLDLIDEELTELKLRFVRDFEGVKIDVFNGASSEDRQSIEQSYFNLVSALAQAATKNMAISDLLLTRRGVFLHICNKVTKLNDDEPSERMTKLQDLFDQLKKTDVAFYASRQQRAQRWVSEGRPAQVTPVKQQSSSPSLFWSWAKTALMVGGGVLALAVTVAFLRNARENSSDSFNFDVSNLPGSDKLPELAAVSFSAGAVFSAYSHSDRPEKPCENCTQRPDQEKLEEDRAEILWKLANFAEEEKEHTNTYVGGMK